MKSIATRAEADRRIWSRDTNRMAPEECAEKCIRYIVFGIDGRRREIAGELLGRNGFQPHHIIAVVRKNAGGRPLAEMILEAVAAGGKVPTIH